MTFVSQLCNIFVQSTPVLRASSNEDGRPVLTVLFGTLILPHPLMVPMVVERKKLKLLLRNEGAALG